MAKKKILLVEDDKYIGKAYGDGLERAGFEVRLATDGDVALKEVEDFKPDIVLLDVMMPVKSGFEVLEELKSSGQLKKLKVIVLSNLGQDSDIEKGKALGAVDFLIKSNLTMAEVISKIKEHLARD